MVEPAVTITAMHRIYAKSRADGSRIVASFDAEFPNFKFIGCSLRADPTGKMHACFPDARRRTPRGSPIVITNKALREAMHREALRIYNVMSDEAYAD